MSKPLDEQLLELKSCLRRWDSIAEPEERDRRQREAVELIWEIAMTLPIEYWGYLSVYRAVAARTRIP